MNLFQRLGNGLMAFVHQDLEPWFGNFLKATAHAAVSVAVTSAEGFVAQAIPALTAAAASGDFNAFIDAQAAVAKATVADLAKKETMVGITAVTTAVNSLIVAHPDVITAVSTGTAVSAAPAPQAS